MKRIFLGLTLSWGFASVALAAGGMEGGGGAVAVCRNSDHRITFAVMEDLYEGQYKYHYAIPSSPDSPDQQIAAKLAAIQDPFDRTAVTEAVAQTISAMTFLPEGVGLAPSTDLGNEFGILIPQGCAIEPVGFYNFDGTLQISREIYAHLDPTNRAAFVMHEALYKLARQTAGETTSANTRVAVAAMFSSSSFYDAGLVGRLVFPFYPSAWPNQKSYTAKVIVPHAGRKFTLKVHPKNDGKYLVGFVDYSFGAYRAGAEPPYYPGGAGFAAQGDEEIGLVDNYDFSALTVYFHYTDDDPAKNRKQSFEYQILDDIGTKIYDGKYDPNAPNAPQFQAVALARAVPVPPLPREE
jgi:hypothetical protein